MRDVLQVAVAEPQCQTLSAPHAFGERFVELLVVEVEARVEAKLGGATQPRHSVGDQVAYLSAVGKVVLRHDHEVGEQLRALIGGGPAVESVGNAPGDAVEIIEPICAIPRHVVEVELANARLGQRGLGREDRFIAEIRRRHHRIAEARLHDVDHALAQAAPKARAKVDAPREHAPRLASLDARIVEGLPPADFGVHLEVVAQPPG